MAKCVVAFSYVCVFVCSVHLELYLTVTPSFSSTRTPFSWYSSRVSQKLSLSFMMSASTAPPRNTMCFRLGGSSIRILNFCDTRGRDIDTIKVHDTAGCSLNERLHVDGRPASKLDIQEENNGSTPLKKISSFLLWYYK